MRHFKQSCSPCLFFPRKKKSCLHDIPSCCRFPQCHLNFQSESYFLQKIKKILPAPQVTSLPRQNSSGFIFSAKLHDQVPPPGFFFVHLFINQFRVDNMNQFWNRYQEEHKLFTTITLQESGNSIHPWCRASKIERTWHNWSTEFVSSMLLNHFGFQKNKYVNV